MYRQHYGGTEHNLMAEPHDLPVQLLALKYIQSITILNQYCKDTGIDLTWTSWDSQTNEFLEQYNFNGFFNINSQKDFDQNYIYESFKQRIEAKI